MNIDPIEILNIQSISGIKLIDGNHALVKPDGFSNVLKNELFNTESSLEKADKLVQALALGEADNLHHVMTSIQEAKMSFEMIVQVRNRLLEGYQDIMKMQV